MTWRNRRIVIVGGHRLGKWWCVRILFVRGSGFIWTVLMKRTFPKSGTVFSVRNKKIRLAIQSPEGSLLINRPGRSEWHDFNSFWYELLRVFYDKIRIFIILKKFGWCFYLAFELKIQTFKFLIIYKRNQTKIRISFFAIDRLMPQSTFSMALAKYLPTPESRRRFKRQCLKQKNILE